MPFSLACKVCSRLVRDAVSRERSEAPRDWYPGLFWLLHACTHTHISTYRSPQKKNCSYKRETVIAVLEGHIRVSKEY